MALYNEVRPQTLSELKGQGDVVKILRKSVAGNTLPNAMIFIGTRGTGKTTVARIIAKMVNCQNPRENGDPCCECPSCGNIQAGQSLDVVELDAASNNGVDDVRRIIELVQYECLSKMRVVILDEVHMLSNGAFNALLKVLEEPPKNVLFILCTTEAHKVPATILSRCRKFQFRTLTLAEITEKLSKIASDRGIPAQEGALNLVAKAAKGSMRDAESIFESFLEMEEITEKEVRRVLGYSGEERIVSILRAVADRVPWIVRDSLREAVDKGENLYRFIEDSIDVLVGMASVHLDGDVEGVSSDVAELCHSFTVEQIFDMIGTLRGVYETKPDNPEVSLLAAFVGTSCRESRIDALEAELKELRENGIAVTASAGVSEGEGHAVSEERSVSSDQTDDAEWDRLMSYADAEGNPFDDEDVPEVHVTESVPAAEEVGQATPKISQKTASALARAGFVLEGGDESDGDGGDDAVQAKEPEKEPEKAMSLFDDFAAVFSAFKK